MKKQNNRFRNSNNNNGYTLNYKFDSVSIAGKISGTALDLIRRYNDLAKEAQSCGNYVEMEIYRQYAEHYRKIVTDINERRQTRMDNQNKAEESMSAESADTSAPVGAEINETAATEVVAPIEPVPEANGYVETLPASEKPARGFQVVEIAAEDEPAEEKSKPKRTVRRRTAAPRKTAAGA